VAEKNQHIVPQQDGWAVKHRSDGSIRDKNSYGNDLFPSKG